MEKAIALIDDLIDRWSRKDRDDDRDELVKNVEKFIWQEVGEDFIQLLDHADLTVRACSAYCIGQFCRNLACYWHEEDTEYVCQLDGQWKWALDEGEYQTYEASAQGMPAFLEILHLIETKELEHPGIAGAWIQGGGSAYWWTDLDFKQWILQLLTSAPEPEPYLCMFPCNVGFYAHEAFSQDAQAIRRLMDAGRSDVAIAAATEEDFRIEAIEPLLIELGYDDDAETVRRSSWQLAYHYQCLHPNGAAMGFVEQITTLPEIDLYLIFSERGVGENPYGLILYAKEQGQLLSDAIARKWVERIFPDDRSDKTPLSSFAVSEDNYWTSYGFVQFYPCSQWHKSSDVWEKVILGYRSNQLLGEPWLNID